MTIIRLRPFRCNVCNTKSVFRIVASTNRFGGGPDLDTRPPEMERSTMYDWIQECPKCGYVSYKVSDRSGLRITKAFLKSKNYLTYDGLQIKSNLARKFCRQYMICMKKRDYSNAFLASLRAAWASDDEQDKESAIFFRNRCIDIFDSAKPDISPDSMAILKADLLRRAGRFKEAVDACHGIGSEGDTVRKLLAFEESLALIKDDSCHTLKEADEADLTSM